MSNYKYNSRFSFRNPLSILGLFITLCYAITEIVFIVGLDKLKGMLERLPFIFFIIIFPFVLLFTVIKLIIKHYPKLYGPTDFTDEKSWWEFATNERILIKYRTEANELFCKKSKNEKDGNSKANLEAMKVNSLESKAENTRIQAINNLTSKIALIEGVVIQKLSESYRLNFQRNVEIKDSRGKILLDGIAQKGFEIYFVECKICTKKLTFKDMEKTLSQVELITETLYNKDKDKEVMGIIAYVNVDDSNNKMKKIITDFYDTHAPNIDLKIFNYKELIRSITGQSDFSI